MYRYMPQRQLFGVDWEVFAVLKALNKIVLLD